MFVLENHVSFKVSPDMFQLEYSTRTGDSASFGLKIAQPDMLQVFVEIVNTWRSLQDYVGHRFNPDDPNSKGWAFEIRDEDGDLFIPFSVHGRKTKDLINSQLKEWEQLTLDGGVNFAGGPFKVGAPDCYHIWRATFFPLKYPMQPGGLMGIVNYCEGVAVADDGVVLPLDS